MKGFNLRCEELKNKIVEDINSSELPITVIDYILEEISITVKEYKAQAIEQEKKQEGLTQDKIINMQEVKDGNTE